MVILGVLLAAAVLAVVISWWSEGYIGATEGIILFAVCGGLVFGLFASSTLAARIIVLIPLVASAVWSAYLINTGSLRSYYKEKVRQYEAAIDYDPRNFAARTKLAEVLYELGETDRAMAEMQMAIDISPGPALAERHTLKRWQEDKHLRQTQNILCFCCGYENERGLKKCAKCGTTLRHPMELGTTLRQNTRQFAVITTGIALSGISLALLPLKFAFLPIGFAALAAVGWTIIRTR